MSLAWEITGEFRPSWLQGRWAWLAGPLRVVGTIGILLALWPARLIAHVGVLEHKARAMSRVEDEVRQLWQRSPEEAVALSREVYQTLQRSPPDRTVCRIPPFGKFFVAWEVGVARELLVRLEFARGDYEAVLALAEQELREVGTDRAVVWKAKCLHGMGRRGEAIELLAAHCDPEDEPGRIQELLEELLEETGERM